MLFSVQALRVFAAFLVVLAHTDQVTFGRPEMLFGSGSINLFFVLSGFIMVYTTYSKPISPLHFMGHRVPQGSFRLYWLAYARDLSHCGRSAATPARNAPGRD